jgi:hypothetical protein
MTPVDFFPKLSFLLANLIKMKQSAAIVSVSLITMAGLYFSFFQPDPKISSQTTPDRKSNATPALTSAVNDSPATAATRHEKTTLHAHEAADPGSTGAMVQRGTPRPPLGISSMQVLPNFRSAKDQRAGQSADAVVDQETTAAAQPRIPVGIQLAPDVRLPVAAMPNDLDLNPIKQKVLQDIVDEYYRTVAETTAAVGNGATVETKIEDNGEETRIITNSPAVDAARKLADQRFKAIFGDAAYTRMTMNTLMESRLSPNKVED